MMIKTCLVLLGTLALLSGETSLTGDGQRRALDAHPAPASYGEAAPVFVLNRSDRNFWFW